MKTLYRISAILALMVLAACFNGCEKKNSGQEFKGSLELFLNTADLDGSELKSSENDTTDVSRYYALLTVTDEDSVPVMEDELLPLYKFGDGFFSEKVEMKEGRYLLMKFMIVDPDGEVIYASPVEGSEMAYLVNDPLPVSFQINPDETTRLSPEVLPVNGSSPSDFGYASFGFSVVKPLPFYILAMTGDPVILEPVVMTDAELTVYHQDGWSHEFHLEAEVNKVVIRGGGEIYKFIVEKENYETVHLEISGSKLMATTKEDPLIVRLGPGLQVLKLQPGPEDGTDAMISDLDPEKNFGDHPYFEATFLTEPILTVMRENRSLIRFSPTGLPKSAQIRKVILTLYYDVPIPWDSIQPWDSIPIWDSTRPPVDTLSDASGIAWYGAVLQQIVEPWDEHEVTWEKQPKTLEANQVYVSPFIKNANFIDVDVTRLFVPEEEIAAPNYGMLFKLSPSTQFPGFRFASSDYKEPSMRPLLKIYYYLPND